MPWVQALLQSCPRNSNALLQAGRQAVPFTAQRGET